MHTFVACILVNYQQFNDEIMIKIFIGSILYRVNDLMHATMAEVD
jgi:hypothetical protein